MLLFWAEKIALFFVSRQLIPASDKAWATYALQRIMLAILFYPILFILGLLCSGFWMTLLFFVSFTGLRHRVGGYHLNTPTQCFAMSLAILVMGVYVYPHMTIQLPCVFDAFLVVASSIVIWTLGPCRDLQLQMTDNEYIINRQKSHFAVLLLCISTIVSLYIPELYLFAKVVTASAVIVAALLIVGKIKQEVLK